MINRQYSSYSIQHLKAVGSFLVRCRLCRPPCLFVGVALGREHMRSGSRLRRAALRFGLMACSVSLRSNTARHKTFTTLQPSYAFALSPVPPRSLDRNKAVFGTATQSQDFLCGVGYAVRLVCSWVSRSVGSTCVRAPDFAGLHSVSV